MRIKLYFQSIYDELPEDGELVENEDQIFNAKNGFRHMLPSSTLYLPENKSTLLKF